MVRRVTKAPSQEQLKSASAALSALGEKLSPLATIWQTLSDDILTARKNGHSWEEIATALQGAGIDVSATALRTGQPKSDQRKRSGRGKKSDSEGA